MTALNYDIIENRAKEKIVEFLRSLNTVICFHKRIENVFTKSNVHLYFNFEIVLQIQRSNRKRVMAHKDQLVFLRYYWETMKVDMSKMLLVDPENKFYEAGKQASCVVFAVNEEKREYYLSNYMEFCRQLFYQKFIIWRKMKLEFLG